MSWQGKVVSIQIGEISQPLNYVESVEAQAGIGLVGDRYGIGAGTFSKKKGPDREITLIEQEALEALEREYEISMTSAEARRNVTTQGVPLNHLVGKEFKIGELVLRGIRLCEPCGHLEKLVAKGKVQEGLRHRGGLRAQIVKGGIIHCGDLVTGV